MAKTIANFLVGIGLDTKDFDKGSKSVDTSLSGFRSKAQLAGGAIAAAFGAAGVAAINAGTKADEFMRKVEKFSTAPRFIYNLGNAFYKMGGQAEDAITTIEKAEGVLDALRRGDPSALESASLAQVDISQLQNSQTGEELLANLADVLSRTGNDTKGEFQRRSLQQTFGLSNEGLKLLTQGRDAMYAAVAGVDQYAANLEKAALAGREYSEALADVNLQFKLIGDTLAVAVLPQFTSLLKDFGGFLNEHAPKIKSAAEFAADNPGTTAAVAGGSALWASLSTSAAVASKLGMKASAGVMRGGARGGFYGATVGAMHGAYQYLEDERGAPLVLPELEGVSNKLPALNRETPASGFEAASISPSVQAARKPNLSQLARESDSVPQVIQIDSKMYLDGREIGNYVERHQMQKNYDAYIESQRTEAR